MRVRDVVDGAALVEFPESSEEAGNRQAVAMARTLTSAPPEGFFAAVAGAATLLLLFDPRRLPGERLRRRLQDLGRSAAAPAAERLLRIPVVYGALDLPELARERSIPDQEFARLHASGNYRVAFLGFAPGFAYLSGLARELQAPRLPTPRTRVPAGSVAIGGPYTGIYPDETPGGWRLIGRSPVGLFDSRRDPPSLFQPGDRVLFEPIAEAEFEASAKISSPEESRPGLPAGRPILRVLSPGLFSSVQGAPSYRWVSVGVPPGGAMDLMALQEGNAALGNPRDAPGLELTVLGPELEALEDVEGCLAGAEASAEIDGRAIRFAEPFAWRAGQKLRVGRIARGMRCYLCVGGGFAATGRPETTRRVKTDEVSSAPERIARDRPSGFSGTRPLRVESHQARIRVVLAEPGLFTPESVESFLATPYRVSSASDRRGVRLEGSALAHEKGADIAPEGTAPGAIQVPRDGQPILLGPDRPVTGGYAKVATVIGADLSLVAQAAPGAVLRFAAVSLSEALEARVRMESP